ncbi:MAG: DNA-methyltransferase [Candidatus Thorarchaeota archaeon]|jgi:site-specific DNA-methyltransferase (adenine-specific)
MTTDSDIKKKEEPKKGRTKRYIPNLAEFYFKPTFDWSRGDAERLYARTKSVSSRFELDVIRFEDCVTGMKQLPDESIDLVIADPPFGIAFDGKSGVYNRDESLVVEGYEETNESYHKFTARWLAELPRIMKPESSAYVFSGWTNLDAVLQGARDAGLVTLNHLIWHYPFGVYTKKRFVTSHYHIVLLVKNPRKYFFNKIENYPEDVWSVKRQYRTGLAKNATKLPLEVVSRCIDFSSKPGDVVLDPFMGNGTTAVSAKLNFRRFIGFEINENLQPLLKKEIANTKPGESYVSYSERLPTIEELAEIYPKAYREYIRREKKL